MEGQGLEQNATHYREQGDVGANAHRRHRMAMTVKPGVRRSVYSADRMRGILASSTTKWQESVHDKSKVAKGAQGRVVSLLSPKRRSPFALLLPTPGRNAVRAPGPHLSSCSATIACQLSSAAGHITRATASAICFRCDSATTSYFLPFGVNR
jgi:hypothetical protein